MLGLGGLQSNNSRFQSTAFEWTRVLVFCLIVILSLPANLVHAQDGYPSRYIRLVVITAAAGGMDVVARTLSEPMRKELGQSVIVENKPGASGNIATVHVANSAPDGYTLLVTTNSHNLNPLIYGANAGYDSKEFIPVIQFSEGPAVLVAAKNSPYYTLSDVVTAAKATPGKVNIGHGGTGQPVHIAAEMLKAAAKIDVQLIPYKGGGPSVQDVVASQIELVMVSLSAAIPHIESGAIRGIAVTGNSRWPQLPNVPTMTESGYPGATHSLWFGLLAPKGTPAAIVKRLNEAVAKSLTDPEIQQRIRTLGVEPRGGTPDEFSKRLEEDYEEVHRIVAETKLKIQ
jgi:tripartite-type tricarboxylate transporter receptor subunit TctC